MADKHSNEQQQSEVKVTSSFVWGMIGVIIVPVILIVLIASIVYSGYVRKPVKENPSVISERIKPIGEVAVRDPNAPVILKSGEDVFKGLCISCHGTGLMGAPKAGDKNVWAKIIAQGEKTLFEHALKGIRGMPAKGGSSDLDDIEVQRAVVYMANLGGAAWHEPVAPTKLTVQTGKVEINSSKSIQENVSPSSLPVVTETAKKEVTASSGADVNGQAIFNATCAACHAAGIAGAPKAGDKASWAARITKGKPVLYEHALQGIGIMPAKGGNSSLSNDEVKAAVDYLIGLVH